MDDMMLTKYLALPTRKERRLQNHADHISLVDAFNMCN
jgi:hypothetical protein